MYYHNPVTVQKKDIVKLLQKTPALHILLKMDHRPKTNHPRDPSGYTAASYTIHPQQPAARACIEYGLSLYPSYMYSQLFKHPTSGNLVCAHASTVYGKPKAQIYSNSIQTYHNTVINSFSGSSLHPYNVLSWVTPWARNGMTSHSKITPSSRRSRAS